jgi:putative nucleotidyltransferase with HDIG domain
MENIYKRINPKEASAENSSQEKIEAKLRQLFKEEPIGRPAVFYISSEELKINPLLEQTITKNLASSFEAYSAVEGGEGKLGDENAQLTMFVSSFPIENYLEQKSEHGEIKAQNEKRVNEKISFLWELMEKNNLQEIYLEKGEDARMLKRNDNGEVVEEDLGRPTTFSFSDNSLQSNPEILAELKKFLYSNFPFVQIKTADGESDWDNSGNIKSETFFKVAFNDKHAVSQLKKVLADIANKLGEKSIHIETGEDASLLIILDNGNFKEEIQGRTASFFLPCKKIDRDNLRKITNFLKNNFKNFKYRFEDVNGFWIDDKTGKSYQDKNVAFHCSFGGNNQKEIEIKLQELKNFLAQLSYDTQEVSIYLETGEDAQIIYPDIPKIIARHHPYIGEALKQLREFGDYTFDHSLKTADYSLEVAKKLELSKEDTDLLVSAALVHDIGKVYVDHEIINKKGPLDSEERKSINEHVRIGFDYIKNHSPEVARIIVFHHDFQENKVTRNGDDRRKNGVENSDESRDEARNGERRKRDERTERLAMILSIIDKFDSLTNKKRPYRKPGEPEKVAETLREDEFISKEGKKIIPILEKYHQEKRNRQ